MGSVLTTVKALGYAPEEYVVIGSGLLDALGLRTASDLDLVVSSRLFAELLNSGEFETEPAPERGGPILLKPPLEIWTNWGDRFETIYEHSIVIDGVHFVSPEYLLTKKRERGLPKDLEDIKALEKYLHEQAN